MSNAAIRSISPFSIVTSPETMCPSPKSAERIVERDRAMRRLSVGGLLREFQEDLAPWTADVLRIGKVLMQDPLKRVEQLFFEVHSARPT
jgi:hypothetical protein